MAKKTTSDCCGCETCVSCGRGEYITHICDNCRADDEVIYRFDGMELCYECLENYVMVDYKSDVFGELFEYIRDMFDIKEVEND